MPNELRDRLLTLIGLAVLGTGLAVAGTTIGVTGPVADTGPGAQFVVSENNVTFSNGDRDATVVRNLTRARAVEVEQVGAGRFEVHTDAEPPLTSRERERAKEIVRNNASVRQRLETLDEYDLSVEPIQRLNASSARRIDGNASGADEPGDRFTVTIENSAHEEANGSVVVDRDPSYVEDEASVRVRLPGADEVTYTVRVDLANETVVDVTDWDRVRRS